VPEICWFCKKNPEDPTKIIEVPIYKVIHQESNRTGNQIKTTYKYQSGKVHVPRCDKCAEAHAKVKKDEARGFWIGVIVLFVALVIFFGQIGQAYVWMACGVGTVGMALSVGWLIASNARTKKYLQSMGTLPESDQQKYPELSNLLNLGWRKGISPTGRSPTKPG